MIELKRPSSASDVLIYFCSMTCLNLALEKETSKRVNPVINTVGSKSGAPSPRITSLSQINPPSVVIFSFKF